MAAPAWQCLGMYALPGRVVTITVPANVAPISDVSFHIGGWTDSLYHKTEWHRVPKAVRSYPMTGTTTKIASALGGLIYIRFPSNQNIGRTNLVVSGVWLQPVGALPAGCAVQHIP